MPIVLAVSEEDKVRLENNKAIVLRYKGVAKAILRFLSSPSFHMMWGQFICRNPDFYPHRKEERCARQFGTTNPEHPCIKVDLQKKYPNAKQICHKYPLKIYSDDHGIWVLACWRGPGGAWQSHLARWSWRVQTHAPPGKKQDDHALPFNPCSIHSWGKSSRNWKQMQSLLSNWGILFIMDMLFSCPTVGEMLPSRKSNRQWNEIAKKIVQY